MTYQNLNLIGYILLTSCGLFLVISVMLFFGFHIPKLIGDLTGANARKAIEQMRKNSSLIDEKTHQASMVNRGRGRITEKISLSGNLRERQTGKLGKSEDLIKASVNEIYPVNETEVLRSDQTTVLSGDETTVLSEKNVFPLQNVEHEYLFNIEVDLVLTHTMEVI